MLTFYVLDFDTSTTLLTIFLQIYFYNNKISKYRLGLTLYNLHWALDSCRYRLTTQFRVN